MSVRYFLDTNVLVYSFDGNEPKKRDTARKLVAQALQTGAGIISYQVVQEFLNVATRKFKRPMSQHDAHLYLSEVLEPLCAVFANIDLYASGLSLMERFKYSFYDSLIIASALRGECQILYSEDLQDGQSIEGMSIVDPFR